MLLTGSFQRALDDKQRFALPRNWRDAMAAAEGSFLYLTPGTDGCLSLYTEETLLALSRQLEHHSPASIDVRSFSRMFYARASQVEIDRQGRIRIPSELVTLASIGAEIMLLGVRDHVEIWQPELWRAFELRTQIEFDQLAERAFARNG